MAPPIRNEVQANITYLAVLAEHLESIAKVDEILVFREVDRTNRLIGPASILGNVIDEAHQGPGKVQEDGKKALQHLLHCANWPGMKKDVQLQLGTCISCDKFHNPSKMNRGKLNPIPKIDRGHRDAIDVFGWKASLPETKSK